MIKKITAIYAFSTIFSSVSGLEAPDIEQTESGMPQKITEDVVSAKADEEVRSAIPKRRLGSYKIQVSTG